MNSINSKIYLSICVSKHDCMSSVAFWKSVLCVHVYVKIINLIQRQLLVSLSLRADEFSSSRVWNVFHFKSSLQHMLCLYFIPQLISLDLVRENKRLMLFHGLVLTDLVTFWQALSLANKICARVYTSTHTHSSRERVWSVFANGAVKLAVMLMLFDYSVFWCKTSPESSLMRHTSAPPGPQRNPHLCVFSAPRLMRGATPLTEPLVFHFAWSSCSAE